MNDSRNEVEKALNDIFGDDFIEISSNDNVSETYQEQDNIKEEIKNEDNNFDDLVSDIADKVKEDLIVSETLENNVNDNNNEKKEVGSSNKKLILYFGIGIFLGIILLSVILYFSFNKETIANCSYTIKDNGYKTTDEYIITKKGNEILYVEGSYNYKALNEEFKKQIEFIKNEKINVVINSYGMPGFTYIYELGDDYFKINTYLDFSKFKYEEIKKINQKVKPISFFEIKKEMKYKSLRKNLEKQGYKCSNK